MRAAFNWLNRNTGGVVAAIALGGILLTGANVVFKVNHMDHTIMTNHENLSKEMKAVEFRLGGRLTRQEERLNKKLDRVHDLLEELILAR